MLAPTRSPQVRRALAWASGLAALWLLLAVLRPGTTFHLAPLLVAGAPPTLLAFEGRPRRRDGLAAAAAGLALALLALGLVAAAGRLQGPALAVFGDARTEALVLAGIGAAGGAGFAWWRGRR